MWFLTKSPIIMDSWRFFMFITVRKTFLHNFVYKLFTIRFALKPIILLRFPVVDDNRWSSHLAAILVAILFVDSSHIGSHFVCWWQPSWIPHWWPSWKPYWLQWQPSWIYLSAIMNLNFKASCGMISWTIISQAVSVYSDSLSKLENIFFRILFWNNSVRFWTCSI